MTVVLKTNFDVLRGRDQSTILSFDSFEQINPLFIFQTLNVFFF